MLPLEGITVVSLEQAIAAPFASRQLADLGARVIKVERPGDGDFARHYDKTVKGLSSHFVWANRSKESLTLDLKNDDGKNILQSLLQKADVFIQNLAPGALDRLGFTQEYIKNNFPHLIMCNISGYGSYGPYLHKKAYDLLIQCESGLTSITGTADTPSKSGISIADIAAGMYAYSGILTALIQKQKTNKGCILEVSMLEALGEWMGYPMYYKLYGGAEPARTGASHATIYPYGPFPTRDRQPIFLAIQNEREWGQFCQHVLLQADLATHANFSSNSQRVQNKPQLEAIILDIFHQLNSEEILARLEKANIANARLNNIGEFLEHPQLKARQRWQEVASPVGMIKALIPPVTTDQYEAVMNPIPAVGEHTLKIIKELGYDDEKIQQLQKDKVV